MREASPCSDARTSSRESSMRSSPTRWSSRSRPRREDRTVGSAVAGLGDCKEEERMRAYFAEHRPSIVFHAAAYKHVALMEQNPVEAVRNNALATRIVARIAGGTGVGTFVLVST